MGGRRHDVRGPHHGIVADSLPPELLQAKEGHLKSAPIDTFIEPSVIHELQGITRESAVEPS